MKSHAPYRLPTLIAGPMIRRATAEAVHIWFIATKELDDVRVHLFDFGETEIECTTENAEPLRIGAHLWLYLVRVVPKTDPFLPHDEIIFYDIGETSEARPDEFLSLIDEIAEQVVAEGHKLPSFVLQAGGENDLRALYGSCRKLHGPGTDMMTHADARIRETIDEPSARPQVILLGGDQIYADDVSGKLIHEVNKLGRFLIGDQNRSNLVLRHVLPRQEQLARLGFTSTSMDWHLVSIGEFVAMYLLAWNGELWDQIKLNVTRRPNNEESGRDGAWSARFVFANCVSYMMFDDHEVTDDWNFDPKWEKYVYRFKDYVNPDSKAVKGGGRLADIVVNGLAAFWIFQAYGNNPDAYSDDFKAAVSDYCWKDLNRPAMRRMTLGFHDWTFVAPTSPPALFPDCRTRRTHDRILGEQIIDAPGIKQLARMVEAATGGKILQPLIVVIPTPLFDITIKETAQVTAKAARNRGEPGNGLHPNFDGATEKDSESFAVYDISLLELLVLFSKKRVQPLVVLCGDVHYAFEETFSFTHGKRVSVGVQLCSSSLKNQPLGGDFDMLDGAELAPLGNIVPVARDETQDRRRVNAPAMHLGLLRTTQRVVTSGVELDFLTSVELRQSINTSNDYGRYLPWNNLGEVRVTGQFVRNRFHYDRTTRVDTTDYCDWIVAKWPVLSEKLRP